MHIRLKPAVPEPYYWIGLIDWSLSYRGNKQLRADYNAKGKKPVKDDDPMPPAVRDEFQSKFGPIVDEGVTDLKKAIDLRPDYDDAMAYLNLLYRQKADLESDTEHRHNDIKLADELVEKVKEIKQRKMENPEAKS